MLKTIQVTDPVKASDVNRIQQNVLAALAEVNDGGVTVTLQTSTPGRTSYAVNPSDQYVVVDAGAGDFSVSLPAPAVRQAVTVIPTAGKVTVQRNDGQAISGQAVYTLTDAGMRFLCTGKTWVKA
jgi:hypothetical protein